MRVSQNGNTANNGFHNAVILGDSSFIEVIGRPSTAGINHVFSQPAWDIGNGPEFSRSLTDSWPEAGNALNAQLSDHRRFPHSVFSPQAMHMSESEYELLLNTHQTITTAETLLSQADFHSPSSVTLPSSSGRKLNPLVRLTAEFVYRSTGKLAAGLAPTLLRNLEIDVHITIGNAWPGAFVKKSRRPLSIVIEHGQMRWLADGPSSAAEAREKFERTCERADHIWITNLDQRTLDIAQSKFPGKWGVLPHPYCLDPRAPFGEVGGVRKALLERLGADFLIFSPSSVSIGGDQRKGTDKLIRAVAELIKRDSINLGLVLVNWGENVREACALIEDLGITDKCLFAQPLPRVTLQTLMASMDLIADQFDYDAFGALTIRALEQGMPLLSKEIGPEAQSLIGSRPPVMTATTTDEIANVIDALTESHKKEGRDAFLEIHRSGARRWITEHHHHGFTRKLQEERYLQLLANQPVPMKPGRWGELSRNDMTP